MQENAKTKEAAKDRIDLSALSGVRVVAFLWVMDNVYWLTNRVAQGRSTPAEVFLAAMFMLAAIWAALHHRRWGWYAMVGMTYITIADMAFALALVGVHGLRSGASLAQIGQMMAVPISFVGEGLVFGLLNIALWVFSAFLLDVDRAYAALAYGKRPSLAKAQLVIAAVVVSVYVVALANIGPTRTALRYLKSGAPTFLRDAGGTPALRLTPAPPPYAGV